MRNRNTENGALRLSRRGFVAGTFAAGALVGAGALAACSPEKPGGQQSAGTGRDASGQAGADDWLGVAPEIPASEIASTLETDLLIVGAGNGGLVAAATAAQEGMDFLLAEKNSVVCETRIWVGAVNSHYTKEAGIEVDPQRVLFELSRYASYKCDQEVIKVWINESAKLIDWLDEVHGPEYFLDTAMTPDSPYYIPELQHMYKSENGLPTAFPGMSDPPLMRNEALEKLIVDAGHEILFEHRLVKLLREDGGAVTGGVFETTAGYVQINAKNTLLTTGGYADNRVMMETLNPVVPRCCTANSFNPGNDGSGQRAALHIGAQRDPEATAMIFDRGAVPPGMAAGYVGDAFPGPIMQFMFGSQPFLKVDQDGRRFANESTPYDFITHAASLRRNGTYVQVFDRNCLADSMRFQTVGCSKIGPFILAMSEGDPDAAFAAEMEAGAVVKAESIEELAEKLQLPVDTFTATVERYNELFDKGVDEDFGKEAFRLSAIKEPPFYGVTLGGSLLTTIDGLTITPDMEVKDTEGNVIPSLYAAGDCSGSFFSGNYPELIIGVAVARTMTFARHAVLHIAGKSVL
ncbi:MAG: FAD-binding protein [Bifidobacteriaceae bacterium]|nr:FAD-binding protein [Bifidobacteriaceae bacterium]